jgi:hypothetical protein
MGTALAFLGTRMSILRNEETESAKYLLLSKNVWYRFYAAFPVSENAYPFGVPRNAERNHDLR